MIGLNMLYKKANVLVSGCVHMYVAMCVCVSIIFVAIMCLVCK